MDEQARRYYDYITNGLKAESPEGIFTRAQIDQAGVSLWGNALTDYHHQCEAELERVELTISDPDERVRAAENINDYYAEKEVAFNRNFDAAVKEIYRENGIAFEDNTLDNREPETVPLQSREEEAKNRAKDERDAQQVGHGQAKFAERTSELPERKDGEKQRDGEQRGRQTDDQERGDLTPKQQLIPPREFIEQNGGHEPVKRQSQNMTRDEYAAQLNAGNGGAAPDRTPPERKIPERSQDGRSRGPGYDR